MKDEAWDLLEKEVEQTLGRIQQKRKSAQKSSKRIFLLQAFLIFLATVCLGVSWPGLELYLKNSALILNAAATTSATIAGYFNYRDRWIQHSRTVGELRALQSDIKLYRRSRSFRGRIPGDLEEYRRRLRNMLDESMGKWTAIPATAPNSEAKSSSG